MVLGTSTLILVSSGVLWLTAVRLLDTNSNNPLKSRFSSLRILFGLKICFISVLEKFGSLSMHTQRAITLCASSASFNFCAASCQSSVGQPSVIQKIHGLKYGVPVRLSGHLL